MSIAPPGPSPLLLGRYRLQEKLGSGRLATVYHAIDERLQRSILIHVLRKDLVGQPPLHQRFVSEINQRAQRSHPALLELFDSGDFQGRPFMVTEHLSGRPLALQGVLAPETALLYMRQIAGAVATCQLRGVPHPPISSRNVRQAAEGQVKLVENWQFPPDEGPLDLAYYRAPERTEGQPPTPSNAVYALGMLLYELLTGQRLAHGSTAADVAQSHLALQLPPLTRVHPLLHLPALDTLLQRATARDPARRYTDVVAFIEALDDLWRTLTADTRPLPAVALPTTNPSRTPTGGVLARLPLTPPGIPQLEPRRPAGGDPLAATQRPRLSFVQGLLSWAIWLGLLVTLALGGYLGASAVVRQLFAVELPQPSLPSLGLPEINLPNLDIDPPGWLPGSEQPEILVVNIQEGLNVRDAPGLSSTVIAVASNGTPVHKLDGPREVDGVPWVQVRIDQDNGPPLEGWMSLNFLTTVQ